MASIMALFHGRKLVTEALFPYEFLEPLGRPKHGPVGSIGRPCDPSGGSLPRRPAAVRSDDITDQLERRLARWHDAGVGVTPPQTLPFAPFSAGAPGPMFAADNEAK